MANLSGLFKHMDKATIPLITDNIYHIFNRGNNGEKIFYEKRNYDYFLKKFEEYLNNYIELYSYCLLPNHFHLLIKVISETAVIDSKPDRFGKPVRFNSPKVQAISKAFSNFFNCYSKSINKQQSRYGNLFQRPFKRKYIDSGTYLIRNVYYIHQNPVHHGYCNKIDEYPWSSYNEILSDKESFLNKDEVLNWFGNREDFIEIHNTFLDSFKDFQLEEE